MKKIFFSIALFATAFVQQSYAQDSATTQPWPLLNSYYNLKDALVASNPNAAAVSAADFAKILDGMAKETVQPATRKVLVSDASIISQSRDLKVQREKFATLSANMVELAKTVKLSADPVYQQYCPMKKASWLSSAPTIKNPYFGNAMLTCGSVKTKL